ncbi:unnamed protein product [Onchocerca ochengi]|uniref:Nuclear envelope integral membrane protein 1 n=1 Tax=Onchocerca ochengi TaxID=42157 RepID=A0A182EMG9_ONCOC|nr:unnamed protein product [Onchocerca ochengi]
MLKKMIVLFMLFYLITANEDTSETCITRELTTSYIAVPEKVSGWSSASTILDLYHCNRFRRHVAHMFMDVYVQINLTSEHAYQLYQDENCSEILQHYQDDHRLWGLVRRVRLLRYKQLNPFSKTIIGVSTRHPYEIRIRVWKINYIRLAIFIGSIALFLMSHSLVKNAIFYYTSGCTIGILASLLIVGFVIYRMAPKITEISIGVITLLLLWAVSKNWLINIISRFMAIFNVVWHFLFPQCQRLLTMEEYQQQGEEETRKALEELRQYCRSPKADVWKITSSVSDPRRLASFVDGTCDHITEEESYLHDLECSNFDDISDDSGEDEYVVAQRSYLSNNYELPRRRYEVHENSTSFLQSTDSRLNLRQRKKVDERRDFNEDENESRYNWQTYSLPLQNSYR